MCCLSEIGLFRSNRSTVANTVLHSYNFAYEHFVGKPSLVPSARPTRVPTASPTSQPSQTPTPKPTALPSFVPTGTLRHFFFATVAQCHLRPKTQHYWNIPALMDSHSSVKLWISSSFFFFFEFLQDISKATVLQCFLVFYERICTNLNWSNCKVPCSMLRAKLG